MVDCVVFVGSTVPFQLIVKYHKVLNIKKVVCSLDTLQTSYQRGFTNIGLRLDVVAPIGGRLRRNMQLLRHLLGSQDVIIFHECCWRDLDVMILLFSIPVTFYPTSSLVARRKVALSDLPLRAKVVSFFLSRWFDMYAEHKDNNSYNYVPVVKDKFRKRHELPKIEEECTCREGGDSSRKNSVLILSGADALPNQVLIDIFKGVAIALKSAGYVVYVKDHPNPKVQLGGLEDAPVIHLEYALPIESIDLENYGVFIGLASHALCACVGRRKVISVAGMLPDIYKEVFDDRLKHLKEFEVFPYFPKSIEELIDILMDSRS